MPSEGEIPFIKTRVFGGKNQPETGPPTEQLSPSEQRDVYLKEAEELLGYYSDSSNRYLEHVDNILQVLRKDSEENADHIAAINAAYDQVLSTSNNFLRQIRARIAALREWTEANSASPLEIIMNLDAEFISAHEKHAQAMDVLGAAVGRVPT